MLKTGLLKYGKRFMSNKLEVNNNDVGRIFMRWDIMKNISSPFIQSLRIGYIKNGSLTDKQMNAFMNDKYIAKILENRTKLSEDCAIDPIQKRLLLLSENDYKKIKNNDAAESLKNIQKILINYDSLTYKQMRYACVIMLDNGLIDEAYL